jgi:signal transduction histidine kinase
MTGRTGRIASVVALVVTVGSGVAVFWLAARMPSLSDGGPASAANALFVVGMTVLAATGAVLVRSGRHRVMGWLLAGTGLANLLGRLVFALAAAALETGHPAAPALGWMTNWAWLPGQALALLLILRFPDGRLPGRGGWRVVEWLVLAWAAVALLATAFVPGPLGAEELAPLVNPVGLDALDGALETAVAVVFVVQPVLLLTVLASPALRWRRSGAEDRRQIAAVGVALGLLAVATPLAFASGVGVVAEGLAWLVLPTAIAYAVVRHDLWDVDLRRRFDRLRLVREEERSRLQRDLHDSLGPLLGSISMRVEAARNLLAADASHAEVDAVLARIGQVSEDAVVEVRRFIDELAPSALADTDLVTALRRLVAEHAETGTPVALTSPADLPPLDPAAEVALYRVAGEALRNVARHAEATRCTVGLRVDGDDVVLEVVDDGVGLRGRPAGVGRRAMAARVAALGGVFALTDAPRGGVRLTARIVGAAQ